MGFRVTASEVVVLTNGEEVFRLDRAKHKFSWARGYEPIFPLGMMIFGEGELRVSSIRIRRLMAEPPVVSQSASEAESAPSPP